MLGGALTLTCSGVSPRTENKHPAAQVMARALRWVAHSNGAFLTYLGSLHSMNTAGAESGLAGWVFLGGKSQHR